MIGGMIPGEYPDGTPVPVVTDVVARLDFATDGTSTWSQVGRINQARTNDLFFIYSNITLL